MLRIGELSRRVGVSDHVLRAWESRYGLLRPARSAGGFRLYSEADENRVRRMQAHLADGYSAAEAARAAVAEEQAGSIAADVVDGRQPHAVWSTTPMPSGGRWPSWTNRRRKPYLIGCSPISPWKQCCGTWCSRTCES